MINGLTGISRKVYEAVPMNSAWGLKAILVEMKRLTGLNSDLAIVQGCLNTMTEQGILVNRNEHWMRVKAPSDPAIATMNVLDISCTEAIDKLPKDKTLGEQMYALAERLRALADDLDDMAIAVDELGSKDNTELEELRKFKATLKGLFQ